MGGSVSISSGVTSDYLSGGDVTLSAANSNTSDGGNIVLESGSSSSKVSGVISITSSEGFSSGGVKLSTDDVEANSGSLLISTGNADTILC